MAILVKTTSHKDDKNRWGTQWQCFADAVSLYGRPFQLEVSAEPETAECERFYVSPGWFSRNRLSNYGLQGHETFWFNPNNKIVGFDGLTCDWESDWYCNPPVDLKREFITKAYAEALAGKSGMMLLPYEPLTGWWLDLVEDKATAVYTPDDRYNFYKPDGVIKKTGVNFGSVFVLFTPHKVKITQ
ncbi:DNA N-6-adenine-methyltransferase [Photobacterium sanguinicancri]|uniref:DNA N-6-adenine-methyltransferase n=1 Tax=Photobacterium sanguinicancri TaxID=875932 RepID=UPI0026E2E16F|nr:DNA N-6-adenine-methyltransferase [Photobacterium sanguinicancri]MDO6498565.1 DNA N-6-adenine-methyltransferase [Photobacterium sanguinicancri]